MHRPLASSLRWLATLVMLAALLPSSRAVAGGADDGGDAAPAPDFQSPPVPRLEVPNTLTLDGPVIFGLGGPAEPPPLEGEEPAAAGLANEAPPATRVDSNGAMISAGLSDGPLRLRIESGDGSPYIVQHQRYVTFGRENLIFRSNTRSYEDLCTTPCELHVAAGAYQFAVIQHNASHTRTMELSRRVLVDEDSVLRLHHRSRRGARIGFYTAMAASVAASFALAVLSGIEERDENRVSSPHRIPALRATSAGLIAIGGGFLIGGVLSRDTVEVERVVEPGVLGEAR